MSTYESFLSGMLNIVPMRSLNVASIRGGNAELRLIANVRRLPADVACSAASHRHIRPSQWT